MSLLDAPVAPPHAAPAQPGGPPETAAILRLPRQRHHGRDADFGCALAIRWCRELSPTATVRLADPDAAGTGWLNRYRRRADVEQAAATQPVAMPLARRTGRGADEFVMLFPLWDLDAKIVGVQQVAMDEAGLTEMIEASGIPAVAATSGPGGGRHIWTASPQGVPAAVMRRLALAASALYPSLDISMFTNAEAAARPPGSPHRDGGHARLDVTTPAEIDEALRILKTGAPRGCFELLAERMERAAAEQSARIICQPAPALIRDPSEAARIEARIRRDADGQITGLRRARRMLPLTTLASLERTLAPLEDHSAHGASILVRLALAGEQLDDVLKRARTSPGLEFLRTERTGAADGRRVELSAAQQKQLTVRQWQKAVLYAARLPAAPEWLGTDDEQRRLTTTAVAVALERMDQAPPARWGGGAVPSGPADAAVLLCALEVMLRCGQTEAELPCRAVARRTLRHHDTAARSLWRHDLDRDYLELTAPATGIHGARYALVPEILDEARRRLTAQRTEGLDLSPDPDPLPRETQDHSHTPRHRGQHQRGPTQGDPPPAVAPDSSGLYPTGDTAGRGLANLTKDRGTVITTTAVPEGEGGGSRAVQLELAGRGTVPEGGEYIGSHVCAGASPQRVTTILEQDRYAADHDQLCGVADAPSIAARITFDLDVLASELFAHGTGADGLGRHATRTYLALAHSFRSTGAGLTVGELAAATALGGRTVARHLRALAGRDLVAEQSSADGADVRWVTTGVPVAEADHGRGAGTAARRIAAHRVQVLVWAWWQAELGFLRRSRDEKAAQIRTGRRLEPYGRQLLGPLDAQVLATWRYPRKAAALTAGRSEIAPDHAEAARLVADHLSRHQAPHSLAAAA